MNTSPKRRPSSHLPALIRGALAAAAVSSGLLMVGCSDSPESLLGKAKESIAKKEPKAAEIHLKNLLQKSDNAEARFLLGTIHLGSGDLRSAEKELSRAQETGFDAKRIVVPLVETLVRLGEPQRALDQAAKAVPDAPEDKAKLATLVGRAHLSLGKQDAARAGFEAALAAKPGYAPAQAGLILLQAAKGDVPGASSAIDQVIATNPGSNEALSLKGDLELAQGRAQEARELFRKAAAADPLDRNSRVKIVSISIQLREYDAAQKALEDVRKLTGPAALTMQLQALIHSRQRKFEPARDAIEASLKTAPDFLPSVLLGSEIYLQLGAFEQAERLARKAIELAPNSTQGYRLLAATHLKLNDPEKALQVIQPLLDKGAKDPVLYSEAGEAALRMNDPGKATTYFSKALELDPKDPRRKASLAMARLAGGDRERGIAELEQLSLGQGSDTQADLALISAYLRDRQNDKALAAIDRLEKKQPGSALAANLRGSALIAKGDAAGARAAFEQALERDPKSLTAVNNLAGLDLRDKKPGDAKQRYVKLLDADPKNVQAMIALARLILGSAGKDDAKAADEALGWLRKAHETDKTSVPATLALAGWYVGRNQAKEAIPLLQDALAAKPDDPRLLEALGSAYLRSEQEALGMETLEKILRARPDDAGLQLRMGKLKLSRGDTSGAMANFRKAAELAPKALEPRLAIAAVLVRTGKPGEARAMAVAIQKEAPKNPAGLLLEGDIAMSERKFGEAAAAFRKALALQPALPIRIKLHQAVAAGGSMNEADALMRSMVADKPGDLALRTYAGEYEIRRQHWSDAIGHYEAIVAQQPNNVVALNNMAWAMHEGKDPRALETAEKALALAPEAPPVLDTAGVILVANGKGERGVALLRKAVAAAPKASNIRLHLAEALIATGDKQGARAELETLLRDTPQGPAADRLKELQKQL